MASKRKSNHDKINSSIKPNPLEFKIFDLSAYYDNDEVSKLCKNSSSNERVERNNISDIPALKKYVEELVFQAIVTLGLKEFYISDSALEDIVYQVMVDVVFDNYKNNDNEVVYRSEYAKKMHSLLLPQDEDVADNKETTVVADKNRKEVDKASSIYKKNGILINSYRNGKTNMDDYQLQEFDDLSATVKKHTLIWDFCYVNTNMITARQYKRSLKKDSRNIPYKQVLKELVEYNEFISALTRFSNKESTEEQFKRILRYYNIESYKRIDHFLLLSSYINELTHTKLKKQYRYYEAFTKAMEALVDVDVIHEKICSMIKKSVREMPQMKKYDEYISVTFFDQYHRPCPYFERKLIKKMIDSKIEILSLYYKGFVEHFLKERSDFFAANTDASFSTFLKEYLKKYYPQQTYAIYQCDIASFLQNITEERPPDDVCEMYKRLFTDFAEALDEKYEVQLSVLHQIRREAYAMFNDNSEFICQDYNQINDFLLKEYGILSLLKQTKQMREYALTHEKGSAEINTIIKEFMRINNAFTQ